MHASEESFEYVFRYCSVTIDCTPQLSMSFFPISVKELISSQDVSPDKVILGGFSQGGALALYTALTMDKPVGGIIGLSTWMPLHKKFTEVRHKEIILKGCKPQVYKIKKKNHKC